MHWATYLKWKQSLEAWCLLVMFGERAPLSCWFGPLKMLIHSCHRVHLCFHPGGSSISQQAMKLGRVPQHVSSYGWNTDNWSSPTTGNATDQPSKPLSRPGNCKIPASYASLCLSTIMFCLTFSNAVVPSIAKHGQRNSGQGSLLFRLQEYSEVVKNST